MHKWSKSVTMRRSPEGGFVAQVDVPWDTAIFYKFVQDGNVSKITLLCSYSLARAVSVCVA